MSRLIDIERLAEEVVRDLAQPDPNVSKRRLESLEQVLISQTPQVLGNLGPRLLLASNYLRTHGQPGRAEALARLVDRATKIVGKVPAPKEVPIELKKTDLDAIKLKPNVKPAPAAREGAKLESRWSSMTDTGRMRLAKLADELTVKA